MSASPETYLRTTAAGRRDIDTGLTRNRKTKDRGAQAGDQGLGSSASPVGVPHPLPVGARRPFRRPSR
ncbi:hypothetical protein E2C01_009017 [Portunus trituberculatus]|uniref:Uncharacterized protein n=1 Tax=Portunus trituberculatus TaxID=210409 RepID=A0A5B7D3T9_PORTR|nr:hypothetical protein [Portunus trituberculatus]